jgi:hypothetical protein
MSFLNWKTEDRLKKIEAELKAAMADTEFQIGSPAAVQKVAESVLALIEALRQEPGPVINYNF